MNELLDQKQAQALAKTGAKIKHLLFDDTEFIKWDGENFLHYDPLLDTIEEVKESWWKQPYTLTNWKPYV